MSSLLIKNIGEFFTGDLAQPQAQVRALLRAGTARLAPDNVDEGEGLLRKALALVRPAGITKTLARCLSALASSRLFAGDLGEAQTLHEKAIATYRALGEVAADAGRS